jgi:hypothetical protein
MHLGPNQTWYHDGLGTNMHLGPSLTWDQKVCNLVTVRHLGPICTCCHGGLGINMHLEPNELWKNLHLGQICTWDHVFKGVGVADLGLFQGYFPPN